MENNNCPFCEPPADEVLMENEYAYAKFDINPVTKGHALVISRRHFGDYFDATPEEREKIWDLTAELKEYLAARYHPDGFNFGINVGEAAGQTIFHLHVHLIPRRKGDVGNPRGGIRHLMPGKGNY